MPASSFGLLPTNRALVLGGVTLAVAVSVATVYLSFASSAPTSTKKNGKKKGKQPSKPPAEEVVVTGLRNIGNTCQPYPITSLPLCHAGRAAVLTLSLLFGLCRLPELRLASSRITTGVRSIPS